MTLVTNGRMNQGEERKNMTTDRVLSLLKTQLHLETHFHLDGNALKVGTVGPSFSKHLRYSRRLCV